MWEERARLAAEMRSSGMQQKEWCEERGINPGTFRWWIEVLGGKGIGVKDDPSSASIDIRIGPESVKYRMILSCFNLLNHCSARVSRIYIILKVTLYNFYSVQAEKIQARGKPRSFVAVDERMVLNDMEQISGGHLEWKLVKILPAKTGHRHSKGRFEKPYISDSVDTAIKLNLLNVKVENVGNVKETRHLIRQFSECAPVFFVHGSANPVQLFKALNLTYWRDAEGLAVRSYREHSIRSYFQQFKNGLVQYQSQAIAMSRQGFNQPSQPPYTS
jgi:hypothetical protein